MLNELIQLLGSPVVMPSQVPNGVTHDSRNVSVGDIYIAVTGASFDGHDYVSDAVAAGASAVIVNRDHQNILLTGAIPGWSVQDTRAVMGDVAQIVYGNPTANLHLVGVTGTNGKTSTTHIIAHLATGLFSHSGTIGTLGAFAHGVSLPGQRTTPEAPDLQKIFSLMVSNGVDAVAMEVASHALVQGRVNGCLFDAAVFTNLTQDHLDYHGDMESYFQAKSRLFTECIETSTRQGKHPFAVIGLSTNWGNRLLDLLGDTPVFTYATSYQVEADFVAKNISLLSTRTEYDVVFRDAMAHVVLPLGGAFQVENSLAALAWFVAAGGDLATGADLLRTCPQIPGRFQAVVSKHPFDVVVDYAHTPDGLENVLSTARSLCNGKLITVFGCGGDRDRSKRPVMGAIAEKYSDLVIVTSDNPRSENPSTIVEDILSGVSALDRVVVELDRRRAIAAAVQKATPGDLILIAGKGHETYQIIGNDVFPFDDCEVAGEELARCK